MTHQVTCKSYDVFDIRPLKLSISWITTRQSVFENFRLLWQRIRNREAIQKNNRSDCSYNPAPLWSQCAVGFPALVKFVRMTNYWYDPKPLIVKRRRYLGQSTDHMTLTWALILCLVNGTVMGMKENGNKNDKKICFLGKANTINDPLFK